MPSQNAGISLQSSQPSDLSVLTRYGGVAGGQGLQLWGLRHCALHKFLGDADACWRFECLLSHSVMSDSCIPMDSSLPGSSIRGDSPGKNTGMGCHTLLQGIFLTQGLNPGLPHGRRILYHLSHQGNPRILQWVTYLFSRGAF